MSYARRCTVTSGVANCRSRGSRGDLSPSARCLRRGAGPASDQRRAPWPISSLDSDNCCIHASRTAASSAASASTPPTSTRFSIKKYLDRSGSLLFYKSEMVRVRNYLMTVDRATATALAIMLMYAASRWVQEHWRQAHHGMGRNVGHGSVSESWTEAAGGSIRSGSVSFELMSASVAELRNQLARSRMLRRTERVVDLAIAHSASRPRHVLSRLAGFARSHGDGLRNLDRRKDIINADVLDAWFKPSPKVIAAMRRPHVRPSPMRTSPADWLRRFDWRHCRSSRCRCFVRLFRGPPVSSDSHFPMHENG